MPVSLTSGVDTGSTRELVERGYGVTAIGSRPETGLLIADLVESGDCRFVAGNLLSLPFTDHSFDSITSFRLLAHFLTDAGWFPRRRGPAARSSLIFR